MVARHPIHFKTWFLGGGPLRFQQKSFAGRATVFAGQVCEARCGRARDNKGGTADGRSVQDTGVISENAEPVKHPSKNDLEFNF